MGTLRTLLALSVVLVHAPPWHAGYALVGGRNAVMLFYMISGFVIAHVLLTVPAYSNARTFYVSRFLRIFPAYFAVVAFTLVWKLLSRPDVFEHYRGLPASAVAFLALVNTTILGQEWTLFLDADSGVLRFTADFSTSAHPLWYGLLVPQAWTLSLELMFYALAPWIVRRRGLLWTILAVSLALRCAAMWQGFGLRDPWTYRFFPFEIALFVSGMLSYQVALPLWRRIAGDGGGKAALAGTAFLVAIVFAYPYSPMGDAGSTLSLLAAMVLFMPLAFLFQERSAFDRRLGELSYPLYIGHYVMLSIVTTSAARWGVTSAGAIAAVYVVASFLAALALLAFVGHPVERIRSRLRRMPRPDQLASTDTPGVTARIGIG